MRILNFIVHVLYNVMCLCTYVCVCVMCYNICYNYACVLYVLCMRLYIGMCMCVCCMCVVCVMYDIVHMCMFVYVCILHVCCMCYV